MAFLSSKLVLILRAQIYDLENVYTTASIWPRIGPEQVTFNIAAKTWPSSTDASLYGIRLRPVLRSTADGLVHESLNYGIQNYKNKYAL